ncbi:MAG TPA: cytochrome C oxidase subunit IV family protein [Thermoflexus sp.]|nr:cytochrome C oxidase subunit IV family protein [Thermoflexus sp.]
MRGTLSPFRVGMLVFGGLLGLTALEIMAATALPRPLPALAVLAVAKAALILWFYMHLRQLWHEEEP